MIAILEKYEHNVNFHPIVDFVEASHIRYALTINPTVYVSHIRQFWSTARIEATDEGTKILAIIDGKHRTISESSIRRNLKLKDEARISSLPDAKLFENLALMGYNIFPNQKFSFQKGQFSHQWKYLIHTIMQCLSPKSTGFNEFSSNIANAVCLSLKSTGFNEFSSNIANAVVCLATNRVYNFSKMIFDGMVRNVNNKVSKFLMYPSPSFSGRTVPLFDSMLVHQGEGSGTPTEPHHTPSPESSALLTTADELTSPLGDDSQGEAFPTVSGHEAEQDRENILKTFSLPHDSPLRQDEMASKITAQDLEISTLKAMIKLLKEKDGGGAEPSREDVTIKGRSLEIEEEAGVEKSIERGSNDTEELVNVLTSLDAASILTSGVQVVSVPPAAEVATISVPTGSGLSQKKKLQKQIDVQVAREIKEQLAREDQRMNEQIARDAEISRIYAEEELQMLIYGLDRNNETIAKYLQEYEQFATDLSIGEKIDMINELVKYQDHYAKVLKYQSQQRKPLSKKQQREFYMSVLKSHSRWKTKHFKGMKLEEIREKFIPVWKQIEDFIPIASK
nr:hypothetical protein [Tanacetum cinerariifolium]